MRVCIGIVVVMGREMGNARGKHRTSEGKGQGARAGGAKWEYTARLAPVHGWQAEERKEGKARARDARCASCVRARRE